MTRSPRLQALQGDPVRLPAALDAVWGTGDAAVVLGPDGSDASLPRALRSALEGDPTLPPDTALVVPTSGSSGTARSVVIAHAALRASTVASLARLDCVPGERWILALPLQHIAGLQVLARARALGTSVVTVADPGDPMEIGSAISSAEHVALVPTQLLRCLDAGVALDRLRSVLVGGGPMSQQLIDRATDAGVPLVRSYGMTEMCGGCVYDGRPLDGVEVTTSADGTIRLRGPMRASGYLEASDRAASPFSDDGWFTTDDVGESVDGILTVHGRRDDTIISGGVKVSASALERELSAIGGFDDVAIVGVPDPKWGERIRLVVARPDRAILPEEMVRSLLDQARGGLAERVPRTHLPKELLLVERIDRTGLGKLTSDERRRIRELGGATTLSETTSSDS